MCNILSIMTHASMPHIIGETFKEVLRGEKCPLQVCVFVLSEYIHTYIYGSHSFISFPFLFAVSCGFSTSFTSSHCPLVWFLSLVPISLPLLKCSQCASKCQSELLGMLFQYTSYSIFTLNLFYLSIFHNMSFRVLTLY